MSDSPPRPSADATPPHILIVDDDARLRTLLDKFLNENGFKVAVADSTAAARRQLALFAFDLVVLDVMMPNEDGLSLTRSLRLSSQIPILLLTARGDPSDRIAGLEAGADDYLAKPFEPRELMLRIRTIIKRVLSAAPQQPDDQSFRLGAWRLDLKRGELMRGTEAVRLTSGERTLLALLTEHPGKAISREDLAAASGQPQERTIDVQVTRLRRKIEDDPRNPRYLQTVRGRGYILWLD